VGSVLHLDHMCLGCVHIDHINPVFYPSTHVLGSEGRSEGTAVHLGFDGPVRWHWSRTLAVRDGLRTLALCAM